MSRADKAAAIAELSDKFKSSNAAVLTEYRGLTVKQITDLRNSLRGCRAKPRAKSCVCLSTSSLSG